MSELGVLLLKLLKKFEHTQNMHTTLVGRGRVGYTICRNSKATEHDTS